MSIIGEKCDGAAQCCFFETITDYAATHPQAETALTQFGYATCQLTLRHWLEIGYAISDLRFALAFPLICLVTKDVAGEDWEHFCKKIVADGQRYAAAVEGHLLTSHARHGGRFIWNIGHGVAGAVAELLAGDVLRKRGMPLMFIPLFGETGMETEPISMRARFH